MKKTKILIFDDTPSNSDGWKEKIQSAISIPDPYLGEITIEVLGGSSFLSGINILENRRMALREGRSQDKVICDFDICDVLIIDFDLIEAWRADGDIFKNDITGEAVAYLVRSFSDCGYIVTLNQYDTQPLFDLTLRGFPSSFADLNIPATFLKCIPLWREIVDKGRPFFRPWYWPLLPRAVDEFNQCLIQVKGNVNITLGELIGLEESDFSLLPYEAIEFLYTNKISENKKISSLTLEDIALSAVKKNRPKDIVDSNRLLRIAVSRIRIWLQYFILPAQNIVSDFPHVIFRIPGLSKNNKDRNALNKYTSLGNKKLLLEGFDPKINIKKYILSSKSSIWWPVPVLRWNRLCEDKKVIEIQMNSDNTSTFVFCEDSSSFEKKSDARRFKSNVLSTFQERYITDGEKILLDTGADRIQIIYTPSNRLSM